MNIFFIRKILFFVFFISYKSLIRCDECDNFDDDCYKCVLCSDESISCSCIWTYSSCEYSNYGTYTGSDEWYSKISICLNLEDMDLSNSGKVYCPKASSSTNEENLDKESSITYTIKPDSNGYYGQNMVVCNFIYEQSTEQDVLIKVEFSSGIKKLPKVYIESTDVTSIKTKVNVDSNRDVTFTKSSKVNIKVLLKDHYNTNPLKIKLELQISKYAKIISVIITILFVGVIIGCAVFCAYRMYKNNEARREARMYLYRQAQENMARIQQENNNYNNYGSNNQEDSANLEQINKEKLDKLFNGKMAQHLYKKEYNEFGGGCSICLAEFKKKSKVSITSCKHVFHYKCIHDWLYKNIKNPKCPNCNHEILNDDDESNATKEKETKIIKVKRKAGQINNNNNVHQNNAAERGIAINNGFNVDVSQSQRPQLGADY